MIKHLARIANPKPGPHELAFGNHLTSMCKAFNVPLDEGRVLNRNGCTMMLLMLNLKPLALLWLSQRGKLLV
ncbi:hypothetical protein H5410_030818 [Solanum commersonii]|uniref:Uncharacterized protein n=1 Tax=Solanum commersonii TaxID=4109 RepID=A0A9J5YII0_SOLCO|nr:hypothetical protein H5410_030818 [Solanum commersonii]